VIVTAIHIGADEGGPLRAVRMIETKAGRGLVGDRKFNRARRPRTRVQGVVRRGVTATSRAHMPHRRSPVTPAPTRYSSERHYFLAAETAKEQTE